MSAGCQEAEKTPKELKGGGMSSNGSMEGYLGCSPVLETVQLSRAWEEHLNRDLGVYVEDLTESDDDDYYDKPVNIIYHLIDNSATLSRLTLKDMERRTGLSDVEVKSSIKSLLDREEIVEMVDLDDQGQQVRHYVRNHWTCGVPAEEGPDWQYFTSYNAAILKEHTTSIVSRLKVATLECVTQLLGTNSWKGLTAGLPEDWVENLCMIPLVREGVLMEVVSNGVEAEFGSIPAGEVCYKPTVSI